MLDHSLPLLSGYSTRSRNVVVFQRRAGLSPVVLTSPKQGATAAARELLEGIPHYRTRPAHGAIARIPYAREIAHMVRTARRIAEVARDEGARVIHAHSPALNGLAALWAGRRLGLPVVYESRAFWEDAAVDHGTTREGSLRYRLSLVLETFVFKRADRVVVIASAMRDEVLGRGLRADRLTVVPNGVDIERFNPIPRSEVLARRLGLDGAPVLGFIGSFYHYEGLRFLVEALPALRQRLPGARVLLVGGGEDEPVLHALAAGLPDSVVFAGRVPYQHVHDYYSVIDVFVCPRRRMRLTELVTPLKPLEAMAMGIPVLASDIGGHAELVSDGETGLLFKAESQESLVEQASRLGRDPELRAQLGAGGRRWVERERTWVRIVTRYLPIYGGGA